MSIFHLNDTKEGLEHHETHKSTSGNAYESLVKFVCLGAEMFDKNVTYPHLPSLAYVRRCFLFLLLLHLLVRRWKLRGG